ncbi:MAG: N-acetylmuramic acid 6-phosphate etherase [Candidatus Marinimicrobia bacterium]|nr:N-acetylmuramic acid 6-phosphate etherase [Candidatus Neomarinimicrobiota bacterium]
MYSNKITEKQNPNSMDIDQKSIQEIVGIINNEDATVHLAVQKSMSEISEFIQSTVKCLKKGGRLFYIGAGTSGRLGVLDASECPPTYRTNPEMVQGIIAGGFDALIKSIEGAEDDPVLGEQIINDLHIGENDIILGITASGTAPYVLSALKQSKINGAITGLFVCNNSEKLTFIDHLIKVIVGPEVVTGSTRMKAGTATKMVLNMITTTAMIKLNKTFGNVMVDLNASNDKLWDRGTRIIMHFTRLNHESAFELLKSANGEVKTAIVMEKLKLSFEDAKNILVENDGALINIISEY